MIRAYLDWGVISSLKRGEFSGFNSFLTQTKQHLLIPYSPAHFDDLMKSYKPDNALFEEDLNTLTNICGEYFIQVVDNEVKPFLVTPTEYLQHWQNGQDDINDWGIMFEDVLKSIGNSTPEMEELQKPIRDLLNSVITTSEQEQSLRQNLQEFFPDINENSTLLDFIINIGSWSQKLLEDKDYYKSFRNNLQAQGFRLESNAGNWKKEEVIPRIDDFLADTGNGASFYELIKNSHTDKTSPMSNYQFFISAYLLLDMIGYKSDKLPKRTDNMLNIQTDAKHLFYSSFCDYFIVLDQNLKSKSQALLSNLNLDTKVLTPSEFEAELTPRISNSGDSFFEMALDSMRKENVAEEHENVLGGQFSIKAYRMEKYGFNFFDYFIDVQGKGLNEHIFWVRKVPRNQSNFFFFDELEDLFNSICDEYGLEIDDERLALRETFIRSKDFPGFEIVFKQSSLLLDKEEDTGRPFLIIKVSKDKVD